MKIFFEIKFSQLWIFVFVLARRSLHICTVIDGKHKNGHIHVEREHITSQECLSKLPVKMQYQVNDSELKVCSDFKDGRHSCELMVKMGRE